MRLLWYPCKLENLLWLRKLALETIELSISWVLQTSTLDPRWRHERELYLILEWEAVSVSPSAPLVIAGATVTQLSNVQVAALPGFDLSKDILWMLNT